MPENATIFRFGRFEVDPRRGELRKDGVKIKLQQQPFQILLLLLRHPGEVVTREEMRKELWPDDTFVDFDHSVNAAIKRLRDALGESAETPVFIHTLARRGYSFEGSVDTNSQKASSGTVQEADTPRSLRRTYVAAGAAVILIGAAVAFFVWRRPERSPNTEERRLASNSPENPIGSIAVSPDGKYLAYQDKAGIYLKLLKTGETHSLAWSEGGTVRVEGWYPDNAHIVVTREEESAEPSLWRVSVFGGSPIQVVNNALEGRVSPDGSLIAFLRRRRSAERAAISIWTVQADGTNETKVVPESEEQSLVGSLAWAPDGTKIAYLRKSWTYSSEAAAIEIADLRGGRPQVVLADNRLAYSLAWSSDRLLFPLMEQLPNDGDCNAWELTLDGNLRPSGFPVRLTSGPGWMISVSADSDAKSVVFLKNYSQQQIYLGALSPDGRQMLSHKRLNVDESLNVATSWTADSQAVLIMSNRDGSADVYKQPVNGTLPEPLVFTSNNESQPRLSPDGNEVLYLSLPLHPSPEDMTTIFAVPVRGGATRKILSDQGIWNLQCARAPASLCAYGRQEGHQGRAFRFDIKTGKAAEIFTSNPLRNWSLSPDGKIIAVSGPDSSRIAIEFRSVETGEVRDLAIQGHGSLRNIDWSADGKSLLVTAADAAGEISLLNVALDGRVSVLLEHSGSDIIAAIPAPDGHTLAIDEFHAGPTIVWAVDGF
jgi:DNA-binding winged helix-turn-helix (wHTH) protein/Tol biopolymer transport system component